MLIPDKKSLKIKCIVRFKIHPCIFNNDCLCETLDEGSVNCAEVTIHDPQQLQGWCLGENVVKCLVEEPFIEQRKHHVF